MGSSELFRFRSVRAVDSKLEGFSALSVTSQIEVAVKQYLSQLSLDPTSLVGGFGWLQSVSEQLALVSDRMTPSAVIALLPADWTAEVASGAWATLKQTFSDLLASLALQVKNTKAGGASTYGICVIPTQLCEDVELVTRWLLVYDCVSTLASDQALAATQRQLQTADDIQRVLSFRCVALPAEYFSNTPPVLARQPGVTDLCVVKNEWNRYVPGELANVVNVLPGETLATSNRHVAETVQSQSTVSQTSISQTTENSQTTSQSLSSTATSDASINIGVQGQVEVSGQYGPTSVKTSLGAQAQISKSNSTSTAIKTSTETVARAVKTVSQTVTQAQSTRTTIRDSNDEKHSQQNTTPNVIVGMYRWLSEVHRVQLVQYPNRFIVEFEVPEPGAWLRYALANQPDSPWVTPDPGAFAANSNDPRLDPNDPTNPDPKATPLQPTDITPKLVAGLAARWQVQGITAPPLTTVTLGNSYSIAPATGAPVTLNDNSMTVPDGYVAQTWTLDAASIGGNDGSNSSNLHVAVGGYAVTFVIEGKSSRTFFSGGPDGLQALPQNRTGAATTLQPPAKDQPPQNVYALGDINTGTIPVSVVGDFMADPPGVSINVTIQCTQIPSPDDPHKNGIPYVNWQSATFNTLVSAYQRLLNAHNQERAQRLQSQSGPLVVGPPQLNLSRSVAELKRLAIQSLIGQPFLGFDVLKIGPTGPHDPIPGLNPSEPAFNPADTSDISPVVQFFEQAFEWENIVYICYPYFWGGRARWVANATSASADPTFDQFLNAGSARLVVPARPGFENLVNFFLYTSSIWGGNQPPAPNDPGYLSVADEIQAIQVGAPDGTPIYPPWEVLLPTTLLWAGTDPTTLPTNPRATIPPPPQPPASTALAVTSSANPSVFGQAVTLTIKASAAGGTSGAVPTGQVTFKVDGADTTDSPVTLSAAGSATCAPIAALGVGNHAVEVDYLGDGTFGPAIAKMVAQVVNLGTSSIAVAVSPNAPTHRQKVRLSATVTAQAPASGTPSGNANFMVDGKPTTDSPVTLDATGKVAAAPLAPLAAGAHTITVNYLGDGNFAPSTVTVNLTVT